MAARGARPFLLLSTEPYTGGAAGDWWRAAAQVADLVPEVYFSDPVIYRQGPILGSRTLRVALRRAAADLLAANVPASRIGLMLGFQVSPGNGGREGLRPASAWFEVVKLQALAARDVASELGLASVWSWGWGFLSEREADPDKPTAACVWLWTRDHSLCDAPGMAGADFDSSLTEGQISALREGVQ